MSGPLFTAAQLQAITRGYGDAAVVGLLRQVEYDRFHEALAAIQDLMGVEAPELFRLLEDSQAGNRSAYASAITYPFILTWAWITIDELMGNRLPHERSVHVRHMACVVASVAFRCDLEFSVCTTISNECLVLPGLGAALFPGSEEDSAAVIEHRNGELTVTCGDQQVIVPSDTEVGTQYWRGIRHVYVHDDEHPVTIAIDDIDPYRHYHSLKHRFPPSDRLDDVSFKSWSEAVSNAWVLVLAHHHEYADAIVEGLNVLVPLAGEIHAVHDRVPQAFGSISVANVSFHLIAYAMLEEFQKTKLNAFHHSRPLHHRDVDMPMYLVPWSPHAPISFRKYLEAMYAARSVCEYWLQQTESAFDEAKLYAQMNLVQWRSRLDVGKQILLDSGALTEIGMSLLREIPSSSDITFPRNLRIELVDFAHFSELDTNICSRLQLLAPAKFCVDALEIAWLKAEPAPADLSLGTRFVERPMMPAWRSRRWLGIRKLTDADWFAEIAANEKHLRILDAGAHPLDALLVNGQFETIISACLESIADNPHDIEMWLRLALAVDHRNDDIAFMFGRHPEVICSLHIAMHESHAIQADPFELAAWLAPIFVDPEKR